jgi:serine/threonine-protein kinase
MTRTAVPPGVDGGSRVTTDMHAGRKGVLSGMVNDAAATHPLEAGASEPDESTHSFETALVDVDEAPRTPGVVDVDEVSRTTGVIAIDEASRSAEAHVIEVEETSHTRSGRPAPAPPPASPEPAPAPARAEQPRVAPAAAAAGRFPPGALLAERYRIIRLLGRGGMGEVYCADDLELGQRVAIKLLPEAWENDTARLERLRSEVRLARSVSHANVCRVYDIGEVEGRRFLSMEYIEGEDLDSLLRRIGRLPADKAAEIGVQICLGLAAIHDGGVLHRDLKPANLMLDARGRVRIADFGLASLAEDRLEQGMVMGTPAYMAPEQLIAEGVSIRSDLYALGLILYKLLTGRPAYKAKTVRELYLLRAESAPEPPSTLQGGVPPAVDAIVVRCLAPEPRDRPASAREVASALAQGTSQGYAITLMVAVAGAVLDASALAVQAGSEAALRVVRAHARLLEELGQAHGGTRAGDVVLFDHPSRAVAYALAYQRAIAALARRESVELAMRLGIHLGVRARPPADEAPGSAPLDVDSATRNVAVALSALAEPGQILLTRGVFDLARQESLAEPGRIHWLEHGSYELTGLAEPLEICEVGVDGVAPQRAPRESSHGRRQLVQERVVGWRPAPGIELPRRPHWITEKKLGEGGFGEVWLARHTKTAERRVFKFCYDSQRLRALRREITLFRLLKETLGERQDIVRILDWSFEEAPYFIESTYTAGGNLGEWAASRGGLEAIALETRIEIVAQVATALAAAHSVGVLHKDVKPANVLMAAADDGRMYAQLGDFGIGVVTEQQRLAEVGITAMGLTMDGGAPGGEGGDGTRLYMAPELLEGKPATTQADIYALGVLLYQITVGDFTRALAPGWERDVDDELVRADIALAVDGNPQRRLDSAARLAERLRALPARRQERDARRDEERARERERDEAARTREALARAYRRRRIAIAAVVVVILFAATVTVQSLRIAREARAAAEAAEAATVASKTAQQVSGFLVALFEHADPYLGAGRDVSAREILDRGKAEIDQLAAEPEVQATLLHVMGAVYGNIGLYQDSVALLERAVEKRRALHGDRHPLVAESLHALARALERQQTFAPAERIAREALGLRRALLGSEHLDTAATMEVLADVLMGLGRIVEARPLYDDVLAVRRRLLGPEHVLVAQALRGRGRVAQEMTDYQTATKLLQEALSMFQRLPGDHEFEIARTSFRLGIAYLYMSDLTAAERQFLEALASHRKLLGDTHPMVAEITEKLGRIYRRTGRYAEAEALMRKLQEQYRTALGEVSPSYASLLEELALLARVRGDCQEADARSQESLTLYRKVLPEHHWLLIQSLDTRAYLLESWGNLPAAEQHWRDAIEMYHQLPERSDPYLGVVMANLAHVYVQTGALAEAGPLLELATETTRQRQASPENGWMLEYLKSVRGVYASKQGDRASAERLLLDSYQWLRQHYGPHRIYTQLALTHLVSFYEAAGEREKAREHRALLDGAPCTAPVTM